MDIFAEAVARAGPAGYLRKTVGAEVMGMTACPCAQEIMKEQARSELIKAGLSEDATSDLLTRLPMATHNQRGRGSISIECVTGAASPSDRIKSSRSPYFQVYGLLKKTDEALVVSGQQQSQVR